jgi:hypothetical protein
LGRKRKPVIQCCGSGSEILDSMIFDPWIRDQRGIKNPDPVFGIKILGNFSDSLETVFWVKNT